MKESISIKLARTLIRGKNKLGNEAMKSIKDFVESQRLDDHSFMDKGGKSDIYYTLFGWMLSFVLGSGLSKKKAAEYLSLQRYIEGDFISYASYIRCEMMLRYMGKGRIGRLLDHGYEGELKGLSKFTVFPNDDMNAPYSQYIFLSMLEDAGKKLPDSETVRGNLAKYNISGGGYSNVAGGITASVNASSAALSLLGQLEGYRTNKDVFYLRDQQGPSGGFCATEGAPMPDLLSTATALFVLDSYGVTPLFDASEFIEAHWLDTGGFSATLLDEKSDIEYTFYGLLALGAL